MPGAGRKRLRTRRAQPRPHNSSPHCESEKYIELKRFWHEIAALNQDHPHSGWFALRV